MVRLECMIDLFKQFGEPNVHGAFRTRDRSIQIVRGSKCALEEFDDLTDTTVQIWRPKAHFTLIFYLIHLHGSTPIK